jgi:amino acid transporter
MPLNSAPGLAAIVSTVVLLVTYVVTTTAVVAYAGLGRVEDFEDDPGIFGALASDALPSPLDKLVVFAIVTSALASNQTTILPASRTSLSMARQGAPAALGRVHPRYLTPHVSTITIGVIAAVCFGVLFPLRELRLRLAHGAVVHDRLLLRAQRLLVCDLLPA